MPFPSPSPCWSCPAAAFRMIPVPGNDQREFRLQKFGCMYGQMQGNQPINRPFSGCRWSFVTPCFDARAFALSLATVPQKKTFFGSARLSGKEDPQQPHHGMVNSSPISLCAWQSCRMMRGFTERRVGVHGRWNLKDFVLCVKPTTPQTRLPAAGSC